MADQKDFDLDKELQQVVTETVSETMEELFGKIEPCPEDEKRYAAAKTIANQIAQVKTETGLDVECLLGCLYQLNPDPNAWLEAWHEACLEWDV